jgi:hypothetical protein
MPEKQMTKLIFPYSYSVEKVPKNNFLHNKTAEFLDVTVDSCLVLVSLLKSISENDIINLSMVDISITV